MKLLIRGGSITAGPGAIKSYADILAESLLRKGIKVINRSRYQETTFDGIGRTLIALGLPSLIFILVYSFIYVYFK